MEYRGEFHRVPECVQESPMTPDPIILEIGHDKVQAAAEEMGIT